MSTALHGHRPKSKLSDKSLTPPKWVATQMKLEIPLLLEERLWEFLCWLEERNVKLHNGTSRDLSKTQLDKLIQDYVNS